MFKIDIPIIEEFLGSTENVVENISPLKGGRFYLNTNTNNAIFVLTPSMFGFKDTLKNLFESSGHKFEYEAHNRGKNLVLVVK